jgi:dienelactone hydrolase
MGPHPPATRAVPLDVQILEETQLPDHTRLKLTFAAEAGDRVPAYLLRPKGFAGKRPAVLCLHQTVAIGKGEPVGLGGKESLHYALHLVRRGYVCLAPDYPSFGDYPYDFKRGGYQSGVMKAVWNNRRAVDLLAARPEVDPARIGAIGHSLGGHTALFAAAFDDRIKATVSCCGFCSFPTYYGGNLKGWTSDRYMPRIATEFGSDPVRVPFDFDDVLAAIAPRGVLAVAPIHDTNFAVQGVKDVVAKVKPVYEGLGAAARLRTIYPDAGHDFSADARETAYRFLDELLTPGVR